MVWLCGLENVQSGYCTVLKVCRLHKMSGVESVGYRVLDMLWDTECWTWCGIQSAGHGVGYGECGIH